MFKPVDPVVAFAEALSVPAVMQLSPAADIKVLCFGQYSLPVVNLTLRYPNTREIHTIGIDGPLLPKDSRITPAAALEKLPQDLRADLLSVVIPGDPRTTIASLQKYLKPDGILVVALDQFGRGREVKDELRKSFKQVIPYREYAPDLSLFLLASNKRFGPALRPFPPGLKRLNPRYTRAMFDLAADEYAFLYGSGKVS